MIPTPRSVSQARLVTPIIQARHALQAQIKQLNWLCEMTTMKRFEYGWGMGVPSS
jgi:hypothetical protein